MEPVPGVLVEAADDEPRVRRFVWCFLGAFVLAYVTLYNLPFPLAHVPGQAKGDWLQWLPAATKAWTEWEHAATHWFGANLLGLADVKPIEQTGSGDTLYDYVSAATKAAIAGLLAVVWCALDRRGRSQPTAHALVRIYARYALAATMLGYGFHKVFPLQFGALDDERLFSTYGNSSPMFLVWTFMAASPAYTIFGGAMEALGGALLFFRRTTTLGALVSVGVMTNVAMLNYCYDVPVKLYSTHLLAMAVFLLAKDVPRLVRVLLLNRATTPAVLRRRMPVVLLVVVLACKATVVGYLTWSAFSSSQKMWQQTRDPGQRKPLQGIWEVTEFTHELSPAPADASVRAWQRLTFSRWDFAQVTRKDDSKQYWRTAVDAAAKQVTLSQAGGQAATPIVLTYEEKAEDAAGAPPDATPGAAASGSPKPTTHRELRLQGELDGAKLSVTLRLREPNSFPIHARGFRWVQSYPFNSNQ